MFKHSYGFKYFFQRQIISKQIYMIGTYQTDTTTLSLSTRCPYRQRESNSLSDSNVYYSMTDGAPPVGPCSTNTVLSPFFSLLLTVSHKAISSHQLFKILPDRDLCYVCVCVW